MSGQVAKDILAFRERWERLGQAGAEPSEPAFFPGYRGADLMIQIALPELPATASDALVDAALHTLTQLAAAMKSQIITYLAVRSLAHLGLEIRQAPAKYLAPVTF